MLVHISSKFSLEIASLTGGQPLFLAPRAEWVGNEAEYRVLELKALGVCARSLKGQNLRQLGGITALVCIWLCVKLAEKGVPLWLCCGFYWLGFGFFYKFTECRKADLVLQELQSSVSLCVGHVCWQRGSWCFEGCLGMTSFPMYHTMIAQGSVMRFRNELRVYTGCWTSPSK